MKNPGFFGGVFVALILAFCGSVLFAALTPVFSGAWVLRCIITLLTLAYLLYLLGSSGVRTGRVTVFTLALVVAAVSMYWRPPLVPYALLHVALVWLVRCCYFHNGLTGALADLGFCGLGFAAAVWAAERTGTLFPALWCFFLVQALVIPVLRNGRAALGNERPDEHSAFRRAYRSAESALRRISQSS
jgi:hypothetical protein